MKFPPVLAAMALLAGMASALGQEVEPVLSLAKKEVPLLLDTLKALVSIESGSRDIEGLDRLADIIAARLRDLGGRVELVEPSNVYKMEDTPERIGKMVRATFSGTGDKKILLIAHMDTVYLRGMLDKQPFRIDGNRAYGLGIKDDKQGIAVILHALAILKAMDYRKFGTITVLINADEELSSPGSRSLITKLGAEHDATFSVEGSPAKSNKLALTTAGIASFTLNVEGRASHAGSAPGRGINAIYELAHQVLQTRNLSDPETGLKINWTMANGGIARNMIPPKAQAMADVRVLRVQDYDGIEQKVRERIKNKLLPGSKVEVIFERRRPPLEATPNSRALARHAQQIYRELGMDLVVDEVAKGSGTDAAFAALETKAPVIERFGLRGSGGHSVKAEYVLIDSIEPRLYLLARMIMDVAQGKAPGVGK